MIEGLKINAISFNNNKGKLEKVSKDFGNEQTSRRGWRYKSVSPEYSMSSVGIPTNVKVAGRNVVGLVATYSKITFCTSLLLFSCTIIKSKEIPVDKGMQEDI